MALFFAERRQCPRIKLSCPIRYQITGKPDYDRLISDNVSLGGISFITAKFIAPSTSVNVELNIDNRLINTLGRVVWSSPIPHSYRFRNGLQFKELEQNARELLADHINKAHYTGATI